MSKNKGFKLLLFTTLSNIFFVIFFLRDSDSPVFISGNLKIIFLNIALGSIIFFSRFLFSNYSNKVNKIFNFTFFEIFTTTLIPLITSVLFWSLGPTIIDRSLSVNVIGTLYLAGRPLSIDDLNWSLYQNYMNGKFQAQKRVNEQLLIGNIKKDSNGQYFLSKKGIKAAKINIFIAKYFGLNKSSALPKNIP